MHMAQIICLEKISFKSKPALMNKVKEMDSRGPRQKRIIEFIFNQHVEERKPIFDDDKRLPSVTFLFYGMLPRVWGLGVGGGGESRRKQRRGGQRANRTDQKGKGGGKERERSN
jgi:hypothetical protein